MAGRLVIGERPGDLNQALMELGAIVCTPRSPRCSGCPVQAGCRAHAAGTVDERPARAVKKEIPVEHHGVAAVVQNHCVLLVKRPARGRLAGLWEFPGANAREGESTADAALRAYREAGGDTPPGPETPQFEALCTISHAFTHVRVVYEAFFARMDRGGRSDGGSGQAAGTGMEGAAGTVWVPFEEIAAYPLPRAQQRIAEALKERWITRPGKL
jgi:A/G-specific adenine glycosylase